MAAVTGRRVVLVGGGHAHALVLRAWAGRASAAHVTLVSPEPSSAYSGMLPGHVAGHYRFEEMQVGLVGLAGRADVRFVADRVVGLDLERGRALLQRGEPLPFDLLSLDTGSTSALPGVAHVVPVKPPTPFLARWEAYRAVPTGDVVVLGGGLGGIELALAMAHRLGAQAGVTLVEQAGRVAPTLAHGVAARLDAVLGRAGVTVRVERAAVAFDPGGVTLDGGERVESAFTVAAIGALPAPWLQETGLALSERGFVRVDAHLRSVSHGHVFAVGDVAHMDVAPREKAGVYAVRQGPVLADLLTATLEGRQLESFHPQKDYLRLVSLGAKRALAVRHGFALGGDGPLGALCWRLKDRIDRRFMATLGTARGR